MNKSFNIAIKINYLFLINSFNNISAFDWNFWDMAIKAYSF